MKAAAGWADRYSVQCPLMLGVEGSGREDGQAERYAVHIDIEGEGGGQAGGADSTAVLQPRSAKAVGVPLTARDLSRTACIAVLIAESEMMSPPVNVVLLLFSHGYEFLWVNVKSPYRSSATQHHPEHRHRVHCVPQRGTQ